MTGLAASLTGCSLLPARAASGSRLYAGALARPDNGFGIGTLAPNGELLWQSPVDSRCHSGCRQPRGNDLVFFERRPGWAFYVLDQHTGARRHKIGAAPGEHFMGHGVFSPDGRWLYATASRYQQGRGLVTVYDAHNAYRRSHEFDLQGIGPHELVLHPDGTTLVVAVGGIRTHPDYDRIKLNLDTMDPAVVLLDRHTGRHLARLRPQHHQQSSRHLSVSPDGDIYVGYQYQGPLHDTPALLARLHRGRWQEIRLPQTTQAALANYISSVVAHPENDLVAAASPVGGTAVVFDGRTGELRAQAEIPDCAGVQALAGGDFLVSSGQGALVRLGARTAPQPMASLPVAWDHHLV